MTTKPFTTRGSSEAPFSELKPRLRRWEASAYLIAKYGIAAAPATLARLASVGGGPRFQKQNAYPLYPIDELDTWAEERLGPLVSSTSVASGTDRTEAK